MKHYTTVLTIAGSDSGGGAGIQADIKTISACGCYAASVITAVTVQNTIGVQDVCPIPIHIIAGQINAVMEDLNVNAVKIGMLHSAQVVQTVADAIDQWQIRNVVLDPVMVATSGDRLLEESAIHTLKQVLIPKTRIITPNIPEAEILLDNTPLTHQSQLPDAAKTLAQHYGVSVLLKAGHLTEDRLEDIFYDNEQGMMHTLPSVRIETPNTHGTGCTMSSALASMIAQGKSLTDAAQAAKEYINAAIMAGAEYQIGNGHGPVHHFYQWW